MADEVLRLALANERKTFSDGNFKETEKILLQLPQDNLRVKHNLAAVQYLLGVIDAETAISILEEDLHPAYRSCASALWAANKTSSSTAAPSADSRGVGAEEDGMKAVEGTKEGDGARQATAPQHIPEFALLYEGHETALFNLAMILTRAGHAHDATVLLRRLLPLGCVVDKAVLGNSLCLFHALTFASVIRPSGACEENGDADDVLENDAMNLIMQEDTSPHLSTNASESKEDVKTPIMRLFSYVSDSSALVESIKDISNPMEKSMALNNLGAFAIKDKKPYVATLCFQKAEELVRQATAGRVNAAAAPPSKATATTTSSLRGQDPLVSDEVQQKQRLLLSPIRYNAGLCALLREDFGVAIQNLLAVQTGMKSSPVFWVRLGEAALGELQKCKRELRRVEYAKKQRIFSQLIHSGYLYENFEFLMLPNAQLQPGPSQELSTTTPLWPLTSSVFSSQPHPQDPVEEKMMMGKIRERSLSSVSFPNGNSTPSTKRKTLLAPLSRGEDISPPPMNILLSSSAMRGEELGGLPKAEGLLAPSLHRGEGEEEAEITEEDVLFHKCLEMEKLASVALQNALFLLVPPGHTYASTRIAFPSQEILLAYALLYWTCLELHRQNYVAVETIGHTLLVEWSELAPSAVSSPSNSNPTNRSAPVTGSRLPPNLHATLLCYLVEALIHLNDSKKAMRVLAACQPTSLITGSSSNGSLSHAMNGGGAVNTNNASGNGMSSTNGAGNHHPDSSRNTSSVVDSNRSKSFPVGNGPDVAQRSRVEVLLLQVVSTQILSGAWSQAASTMDNLVSKIFNSAPAGATEFRPEADAFFVYQLLGIFLELAQGKQAEAAELLSKVQWSV